MKNKSIILLYIISSLLLAANILLIYQNLNLKAEIERNTPPVPKEGDVLSPITANDLNGNSTQIDFREGKGKTVLFFFRSTCLYCKEQMRYWDRVVKTANKDNFNVTAVTSESNAEAVKEFLDAYDVGDWRVLRIRPEDAQIVKFHQTPITVVVDRDGRIDKAWAGRWQSKALDVAQEYFSVDFSDL